MLMYVVNVNVVNVCSLFGHPQMLNNIRIILVALKRVVMYNNIIPKSIESLTNQRHALVCLFQLHLNCILYLIHLVLQIEYFHTLVCEICYICQTIVYWFTDIVQSQIIFNHTFSTSPNIYYEFTPLLSIKPKYKWWHFPYQSVLKAYLQNFQNLSYLVIGTIDANSSSRLVSSILLIVKHIKPRFSIFEAANFFPQFLHKIFAFPACDFSLLFNIHLSLNFFKHSLHLNSVFLIKHVTKCLLKLSGQVNSLEHF